jgi:hypothetical protein
MEEVLVGVNFLLLIFSIMLGSVSLKKVGSFWRFTKMSIMQMEDQIIHLESTIFGRLSKF